jgi:cytochrome c oxidase subunit III
MHEHHHHSMTALEADTFPAEQFEDAGQQYLTVTLGMWAFLITEIMFIGAVFMTFFIYRQRFPEVFMEGGHLLSWKIGAINTVVLLTSSYTMVMAVHFARIGDQKSLVRWLVFTMVLGLAFVIIKSTEYTFEYYEALIPGLNYSDHFHDHERPRELKLFMTMYFAMTGLHALHMIVGLGVMLVITYFAWRGSFTAEYNNPVDMAGLYWHFVDLVWVFLFPTLYLLGGLGH